MLYSMFMTYSMLYLCFSFLFSIPSLSSSALSTCLTLNRGIWRPSLWSLCSSTPPTTLESQATSATQRPPPSGTTKLLPQTGTGSMPAKQPSRVVSALWHRTVSLGTRHLLQLGPHVMNSDDVKLRENDSRFYEYAVHTRWMSCVCTLEETHTNVHMDKSRTEMSYLLPDERTLRIGGRRRRAESGTRARTL